VLLAAAGLIYPQLSHSAGLHWAGCSGPCWLACLGGPDANAAHQVILESRVC
jgi:hypothetical protein